MKLYPSSSSKLLTFSSLSSGSPATPKLQLYPSWRPLSFIRPSLSCKSTAGDSSSAPKMTASEEWQLTILTALSSLDGRYWDKVNDLSPYMSEFGLIYHRVLVEVKWLLKLSMIPEIVEVPSFSEEATSFLEGVIDGFGIDAALQVKKIERVTNHDLNAVEYFLKQKCQSHPEIAKVLEFFHFACTSEDINNLALALMLKDAMNKVMFPVMDELIGAIAKMAADYASIPMLSRTHGQEPASTTTIGKEMANFAYRLSYLRRFISGLEIMGKFAGASGNYSAHLSAYPNVNWPEIAKDFVESLGLCFDPCVSQIEPHYYMGTLFSAITSFNAILIDFDQHMGGYISVAYFKQITKAGEIGSSTMPHKVNPIDFENSAHLMFLAQKLPISLWQLDLTDSTVLRNMGEVLAHSLLAYKSTLKGIGKLQVNEARLWEDLDQCWELLAEPIQAVMRRYGVPEHYEKLEELTRGGAVTKESIRAFIEGLEIPQEPKTRLLEMTPHSYAGAAVYLAKTSL